MAGSGLVGTPRRRSYDDCRSALARLRDDDPIVELIAAVGAERGWWPQGRSWRREYARFDLGSEPLVALLFESAATDLMSQELCTIEVWSEPRSDAFELPGSGWLTFRRFPDDDHLPGLPSVRASRGTVTVLRYRPDKRCTLRVADGGVVSFVKVFSSGDEGEVMNADALAILAAAEAGELGFRVAPPIRWDAASSSFWQGSVPGSPAIGVLFGPDGAPLAEAMGRAAATLTTSSLQPTRRTGRSKQMKRSAKYAARIAGAFPQLRDQLDELLVRLEELHLADTDGRLRPIHGAPHPHQWLLDRDRTGEPGLGLVDFDGFALGPPELDVATFIAEMEYEQPERMPVAAIVDGFREGYEQVAGPLDERVLRAYVAHKRLAKAQRNARAVRDDNDVRAAAAIAAALVLSSD